MSIPAYLARPDTSGHCFGTLEWGKNAWIIRGEPAVIEAAKRLFPGSSGRGPGIVRFPGTKRISGDLNWLMLRYPLEVIDQERWERQRQAAIDHVFFRQAADQRPQRMQPPATFDGKLHAFQEVGLAWLLNNRRTILADEQGTGKTVQALAFLAAVAPQDLPALVVTPSQNMEQWADATDEFLRLEQPRQPTLFDRGHTTVHHIRGLKPYPLPPASVYITHYGLLRGWKEVLPEAGFGTVIFDEIQELRHTRTEKYSAASLVAGAANNAIGLSGTPIHNYGIEMQHVVNIIEYHALGDEDSFSREWCTGYGEKVVKDPALLGDYLRREGLLLRRLKADVMPELPPKYRHVQTIAFDQDLYDSAISRAVDLAQQFSDSKDRFERGRLKREAVDETRRVTGLAKAGHVAAFARTLLRAGQPVLLAAYHHDVWDAYGEILGDYRPAMITGRQTPAQKNREKRRFSSGETDLCCISLRTGAGIDGLQKRCYCTVFGELDWAPAIHAQIEDRLHRWGQLEPVHAYYLVAPEGTDQEMIETLGLKVQQFTGIMGDKPETEEDRLLAQTAAEQHMEKVMERLRTRAGARATKGGEAADAAGK